MEESKMASQRASDAEYSFEDIGPCRGCLQDLKKLSSYWFCIQKKSLYNSSNNWKIHSGRLDGFL